MSDVSLDAKIDGNHHLGHILLECLKKRRPDDVCTIDAATKETITFGSTLTRTIRLARSFRNAGFKPGDTVALSGRNNLSIRIPFFVGLINGLQISGIDPAFKYDEIKSMLNILKPKVIFCERETYNIYEQASTDLESNPTILTFQDGEHSMDQFIETYDKEEADEFYAANFDTDKVYAWLISTSGTTGSLKVAAFKHADIIGPMKVYIKCGVLGSFVEGGQKVGLCLSPVQWISWYVVGFGMPLMNTICLQTSKAVDPAHIIELINEYKPAVTFTSPALLSILVRLTQCDLTCFDLIFSGGSKIYQEMMTKLKSRVRDDTRICEIYGQTETVGPVTISFDNTLIGSCGPAVENQTLKLVDVITGEEINEPHKPGELWVKGPRFTEYVNNPAETAKVLTEDGWVKSGDLLYRDANGYYYFVERFKLLIKYRNTHIIPPELEEVILSHAGVEEVSVTGFPDEEDGFLPVAVVVKRPGSDVTAQEIKDLVADKLSDSKRLRGGVIFVDVLPKTTTGKPAYEQIKKIVLNGNRE